MICYKVVTNLRGSISVHNSKYRKIYEKGTIVRSDPNTLGIFCFETEEDAIRFSSDNDRILKVKPIGRKKKPSIILDWQSLCKEYLDKFYSNRKRSKSILYTFPPKGTVCYPAVEVLE